MKRLWCLDTTLASSEFQRVKDLLPEEYSVKDLGSQIVLQLKLAMVSIGMKRNKKILNSIKKYGLKWGECWDNL